MSGGHQLNASTPFLRGVPNSQISPEWYRLLASIVQIIYPNSQHIVDLSGFEDFTLGELPYLQDASIASLGKSIDSVSALVEEIHSDPVNARNSDLVAQAVDVATMLQEAADALNRALKAMQDFVIDQSYPQDAIRSMAYQDAGKVKITGGSITGTTVESTSASIADDTTTNATMYPIWVTATGGIYPLKTSSTKFTFNPATGTFTATIVNAALNGTLGATTPAAATVTAINKITITTPATGATLTLTDGKTFAVNNTLTLAGTDSTTMTFPSTSATIARTDAAQTFTGTQTVRAASTQDAVAIAGRAGGTSSFVSTITPTTLSASRTVTLPDANTTVSVASQVLTFSGPTAARTITLPDANFTAARTDAAQTFSGAQNINANLYIGSTGTSPLANLNISGTGGQNGGIQINRNLVGGGSPTSGQSLGSLGFKGLESANSNAAAEAMIEAIAAENQSGSTAATDLVFYTKPTGTGPGSAPSARARIKSSGEVLIGTSSSDGANQLQIAGGIRFQPQASSTPSNNGDLTFELTSNTQLKIKVKGSDGTVRSNSLTLA